MKHILLEISSAVATITLNRADKRNALSAELVQELRDCFDSLRLRDDVRVVILAGAGKAFCAGADLEYLKKLADFSILENMADSRLLQEALHTIFTFPKPVIAKVHGAAIAGGCGLATVCDFVIASEEKALFGYSEVKIGFIPAIVLVYLIRKIGDTQARRLTLSAQNISAKEAERIGLITKCVPDETLDNEVNELALTLAQNSASAMMLTKEMLTNLQGMSLEAGLRYASSMNALARNTEDCKNGIERFLTK